MNKIPKLRFPEFTGEWEEKELGEICEISKAKYNPEKELENYKCLELEHFSQGTGRIIGFCDSLEQKSIKNKFKTGEVLFGKLRPYLKKYWKADFEGVCSSEVWVMRGKKISNNFLYRMVQSSKFNLISNISAGSKMPRADWDYMSEFPFFYPSLPEQEEIASFLSSVDSKIEKLERKKELWEQYKKGMMQKIFSQELRFKGENGEDYPEWEEKSLGEIAIFRRGSFPQPYGLAKWYDNLEGQPFIQVFDVAENMKLKTETKTKISLLGAEQSVFVEKDMILVTLQGSIGRVAKTQYCGYVDRTLLIFQSYKIPIDIDYFKYALFLLFEIEKLKAPGGIIKTITKEVLSSFTLDIPSLPEQTQIADFLSSIDSKIEIVEKELLGMKEFKKGLLQKMFV